MRDVGCYCIRLARLLFDAEPIEFAARASWRNGVDADCGAVLDFPDDRRLLLSAGMRGAPTTLTRVLGDDGELRIANPFHPRPGSTVQRWAEGQLVDEWTAGSRLAFQCGVEHVHAVLAGDEEPRHLARTDALGNAAAIDGVIAAAR
jgi:predicted dehydrogenase